MKASPTTNTRVFGPYDIPGDAAWVMYQCQAIDELPFAYRTGKSFVLPLKSRARSLKRTRWTWWFSPSVWEPRDLSDRSTI